jgi:hypothetical protein
VGASQKLNLKRAAPQDAKGIWTSKSASDENDLIDEESLLSETDRNAKPKSMYSNSHTFIIVKCENNPVTRYKSDLTYDLFYYSKGR